LAHWARVLDQTLGLRFVLFLNQQFPPFPAGPPDYVEVRSFLVLVLLYRNFLPLIKPAEPHLLRRRLIATWLEYQDSADATTPPLRKSCARLKPFLFSGVLF
jgi:hypothetical protein